MIINRWILALRRNLQHEREFQRIQRDCRSQCLAYAARFACREATGADRHEVHAANIRRLAAAVAADRKIWGRTQLSIAEQTHERQKSLGFYRIQIELLKYIEGKTIVEIGSARARLRHPITEFNPVCCNDGHSTYHWASTPTFDVHTVDIDSRSRKNLERAGFGNMKAYTADGIQFLKHWNGPSVDLLYLDAWDVGVPGYAEKHLEAYHAIRGKLSPRHIIGIDDTDFAKAGKGQYLVPHLESAGYKLVATGRQTIFVNFDVN